MASACVNNISVSPPWHSSPEPDFDFEFPLHHKPTTSTMLPADQLFSDGKLLPLHLTKPSTPQTPKSPSTTTFSAATSTTTTTTTTTDPYLFSPKAPRCSSRWKDLLGLKKLYQTNPNTNLTKTTPSSSSSSKTLKNLLHRNTTKTTSSSENAPLLTTISSDSESLSLSSSRLSLSSSSSSHDHDDLPRLSLDSDKPNPNPNHNNLNQISLHRNPNPNPRIRLVKPRTGSFDANRSDQASRTGRSPIRREPDTVGCRGVSVDSPRMNSSGKIVFQSLERSSSSPSTFNGGPRFKHRGMERSYSANVRVTPVLNVPVCSLRGTSKSGSVFGFGQLFSSPQKKEGMGSNSRGGTHHHHQQSGRNRN